MNSDILKGKWRQMKGEIQNQWGKLTNDDLDRVEGNAEKLAGVLQERYGYERAEAEREVDSFLSRHQGVRP
ncbi:MAG TPA: CsbD family protein [Methylomirabilota bacterium]